MDESSIVPIARMQEHSNQFQTFCPSPLPPPPQKKKERRKSELHIYLNFLQNASYTQLMSLTVGKKGCSLTTAAFQWKMLTQNAFKAVANNLQ